MSKALGQHFLKNKAIVQKTIAALDVQAGETILEFAGQGALTISLAEAARNVGAKIIAIEKDAALAEILKNKLLDVDIVTGDVLEILKTLMNGRRINKIVGNIPYYISGHLLREIGELEMKPRLTILMLQKEVAERICSVPPKMNRLAASVQCWAEPKIIASLSKKDFSPAPNVDSAVIKLTAISPQPKDLERYYAAMRTLFAQPRKTVLNNLMGRAGGDKPSSKQKEEAAQILQALGINPILRPQDLTIENIRAIANVI